MSLSKNQGMDVGYYLSILSKRRWLIIVPFCIAVIVGSALTVLLPKRYVASTLVLIQPQEVSEKLVPSVVTGAIGARISNISQQVLSRDYLEKVIQRLSLSADPTFQEIKLEDRILGMRERIEVDFSPGKGRKQRHLDAFSISYQDKEPRVAMLVANELANIFVEENAKMRGTRATETSGFLEAELEGSRKRIEAIEQELNEYRQKHMGELPEQLDTNLRILDRLNASLNQKERSLQDARINLAALENELTVRQNALIAGAGNDSASTPSAKLPEEYMSLPQLKEKLAGLRTAYTEQHPDVVRLKAKIEKIEMDGTQSAPQGRPSKKLDVGVSASAARQTTVITGTIRTLETEIANLNMEIKEYQRRVEATPTRELELLALKRDYDNMNSAYDSLLKRKLEAEVSANLEKKQKSEQFQIIEPAELPKIPTFPDPRKLFVITIAAGLGLAVGLIFLLEISDTSLRTRDDLEDKFGLAILATVPRIFDEMDVKRHRIRTVATAVSVVIALLLTVGFVSLNFNGVENTFKLIGLHG
jgi:polysaccharide chain length determinant protein (PEP-CTERM system associated)